MTIHFGVLSALPVQVHTVILLGSRTSDHLRELIRIAEFRGRAAYRIERAAELEPAWFKGEEHVGVVLGTFELQEEMNAVVERLDQFDAERKREGIEGDGQ